VAKVRNPHSNDLFRFSFRDWRP